jgi:2-methylcitrate dehydratase PrpD
MAIGVMPRIAWTLSPPVGPVITTLSSYMADARIRALPEEVIEQVKYHVLDTLAAMVSGADLVPGKVAIEFARSYGGKQVSTVVASDVVCGAIEAALTNGILAHSDETDDSHAPSQSHPGCAIVPAALALGEQFEVEGTQLLRAVALGYDVGTRIMMALGGAAFQSETHRSTHAIAGIFGASAAAASVANLSAQQMRWTLDYADQQASGLASWQRGTDHIEKAFVFGGMPARSGVTAALLVHSGWTGVDDIFSGPDNLFITFSPNAQPASVVEELGQRYEVTRTNIKKWTVGSPIQAPLDAIETLFEKHQFQSAQVQKVVVRIATEQAAIVNNRDIPDICLQYIVAVMLQDRTVSFRAAHDKLRMQDPSLLRMRQKVNLIPDEKLDRLLPKRVSIVEIVLSDGSHFVEQVDAVRGTAQNPMNQSEVVAKCRELIGPVLGEANGARLINKVLAIESVKNLRELRPLLCRA